jgi:hypothetical protein
MRNETLKKYSVFIEWLLTKNHFDIKKELSKRNLSHYISTSLLKLNLIRRVNIGEYRWNIDATKADAENISKRILIQRLEYDKSVRDKKKKIVQLPLIKTENYNELTVENCIAFLKAQTDCTYEVYRIDRNKL